MAQLYRRRGRIDHGRRDRGNLGPDTPRDSGASLAPPGAVTALESNMAAVAAAALLRLAQGLIRRAVVAGLAGAFLSASLAGCGNGSSSGDQRSVRPAPSTSSARTATSRTTGVTESAAHAPPGRLSARTSVIPGVPLCSALTLQLASEILPGVTPEHNDTVNECSYSLQPGTTDGWVILYLLAGPSRGTSSETEFAYDRAAFVDLGRVRGGGVFKVIPGLGVKAYGLLSISQQPNQSNPSSNAVEWVQGSDCYKLAALSSTQAISSTTLLGVAQAVSQRL
jgi:hypothetical protein